MSVFWKIFGIFMILWFIWYFSGGPQRSTNVKPYLKYDYDSNTIYKSNTDLETGAKEMINLDTEKAKENLNNLQNNFENPTFTQEEN